MMDILYKVYIKVDDLNRVIDINSSAFLQDTTGWTQIDEGEGDRYHHAQHNYLPKRLIDDQEHYRYKLADGIVVERTEEEIFADDAGGTE
ncbi:MAG: hypothetical protein PHY64_00230 [Eubacteriales bacterium]|nr:hypothetical protein [Eubacteriales bacterium]